MDALAELQAAHEVLYRLHRAGVWSRRVGVACVLIGAVPLGMILLDPFVVDATATRMRAARPVTLAMILAASAALLGGGALLARGGHRMLHIVGTREPAGVRRACGLATVGAALASIPAAWTVLGTAFALLGLLQRNGPAALIPGAYVGCFCLLPAALPLPLAAVNGLLWLRYPVIVARIQEGREALRAPPVTPPSP